MNRTTVPHYRILERLAGAGMEVISKARDTRLEWPAALKVLPEDLTRDEQAKNRSVHEEQSASPLHYPDICIISDRNEPNDDVHYNTQEGFP